RALGGVQPPHRASHGDGSRGSAHEAATASQPARARVAAGAGGGARDARLLHARLRRAPPAPPASGPAVTPAIELRDLAKSYGSVHAVRGVTLRVERGEIFGFLGLNGAGKTTTIRVLLDLIRPTRGSASLFGLDCQRDSRRARTQAGYLPGELGLYPDVTAHELLELTARLSGAAVDPAYRSR